MIATLPSVRGLRYTAPSKTREGLLVVVDQARVGGVRRVRDAVEGRRALRIGRERARISLDHRELAIEAIAGFALNALCVGAGDQTSSDDRRDNDDSYDETSHVGVRLRLWSYLVKVKLWLVIHVLACNLLDGQVTRSDGQLPRRGPLVRRRLLPLILSLSLVLTANQSLAHTAWFTIWAWQLEISTGVTNHWQANPYNPYAPYDYMVQMEAFVYQWLQQSFDWKALRTPGGWEAGGGIYGFKGDSWIIASQWGQVHYTSAFFCRSVLSNDAVYINVANPTPSGHWELDSGAGDLPSSCYTAYRTTHNQAVQTNQ